MNFINPLQPHIELANVTFSDIQRVFPLDKPRSRPDKHSSRVAWNRNWDKDLQVYGTCPWVSITPYFDPNDTTPIELTPEVLRLCDLEDPEAKTRFASQSYEICALQTYVSLFGVHRCRSSMELLKKWNALSLSKRQEIILESFYRVSIAHPNLEMARRWCPEATLNFLANSPTNMLSLATRLVPYPTASVRIASHFRNILIDRLLEDHAPTALVPFIKLERAHFLASLVWNFYLVFFNEEEKQAIRSFGLRGENTDIAKVNKKISKSIGQEFCWNCGKAKVNGLESLKKCAKCQVVGVTIFYCSKECQKNDWRNGDPIPHKDVCAKPDAIFIDEMCTYFPKPLPSFHMTREFIRQIEYLKSHKDADYVIFYPAPKAPVEVQWPDDGLGNKHEFLARRRRGNIRINLDLMSFTHGTTQKYSRLGRVKP
ncbi:hypothetical protein BDQ12DRAFT_358287 [Crucibulum laeve]|uniref:MYND-type domain-containing protein n=1 Tax=Crucibulum laeve TaxID=68775 RepID=A0A5C3MEE7_9AGAR|nr:hypothetical protein BDQ12DRAFT_358287 [Crucibulum laeve]